MCTSPVFAYSVVPLKSFGMVPSSGCCEGSHIKVLRKTAPLSRIARSTHSYRKAYNGRVERCCKLLRGMWGIETCIYKTAGQVQLQSLLSSCSQPRGTHRKFHCGNYTLECSYVESFRIPRILYTCGTTGTALARSLPVVVDKVCEHHTGKV